MKRKLGWLILLALLLSGCQPVAVAPPPKEPEAVIKEQPAEPQPPQESEKPEVIEPTKEVPAEVEKLRIDIEQEAGVYLNAFVEITQVEQHLSYMQKPVFYGPANLVHYWNQEVGEKFYTKHLEEWQRIQDVQTRRDSSDEFSNFTVYRTQSSVFEDPENLVLLARNLSVYGYSWLQRESEVFFIDKTTGDALEPSAQLAGYGITMEDALATLQLFQEDNSQISFDDMSLAERTSLFKEEAPIQETLGELYGREKPVILNDFKSHEAYVKTRLFVAEFDGKLYYVFKLLLASLEINMLDGSYRSDLWVGVPVNYKGGELQRFDNERVDGLYQQP